MITHDVDEAILLADKIMLMSNGPRAKIAEIVAVTMPRSRTRRHPPRPAVLPDPQPPGGLSGQSLEDLRRGGGRDLPRPEKPAAGAAGLDDEPAAVVALPTQQSVPALRQVVNQ
jgi:nitrate/nitrite transport system ATP-binding protein